MASSNNNMDKNIISIEEATKEEKKRKELDARISKQEQLSWQIVVGVVIAFLFTLGLVGIEIMLFHTRTDKDSLNLQNQYFQEIKELREQNFNIELHLKEEINKLKIEVIQKNQTVK